MRVADVAMQFNVEMGTVSMIGEEKIHQTVACS